MAAKGENKTLEKLSGIVGKEAVTSKPDALAAYASCLGSAAQGEPSAVVKPKDRKEVQAVVKLANELKLNLIPASSGGPRFRGGTVPNGSGIIVDLSGMKNIIRVDKLNMVAMIEAGVTFEQFEAEAEKQQLRVFRPFQPRASKSVIASYLEREPVTIPKYHWDVGDPMLTAEIVFGVGDVFRTGSAAGPGTLQQQWDNGLAQKNPEGPAQTSLNRVVQGAQGTLGIVTWSSVKLGMLPQIRRCYFASDDKLDRLIDFSYRVNRLKFADEFLILNSAALAAAMGADPDEISRLQEKQGKYTVVWCVCGYWHCPEKRMLYQEKGIADFAQQYGVRIEREVPGAGQARMLELLDKPSAEPYYKIRKKGGVREVFFVTTLDKTPGFIGQMEKLASGAGFSSSDIGIYIQPFQQGRNVHLEFQLYFDPANSKEASTVDALAAKASADMADAGAFFSRPYGAWSDIAYSRCPDTVKLLKILKNMFDPNGVLNRGKLCYGEVG
jgi:glycolate oxidase